MKHVLKRLKSIGSLTLCCALCISNLYLAPTVYAQDIDDTDTASEKAAVSVYPTPQDMTVGSEEGMKLNGNVDIVVYGKQDSATLPKLEALLESEGYSFEVKDEVGENAAVVLAIDDGGALSSSVNDSANALNEAQGYVLESSDESNKTGQITIIGSDSDGVYYGVMTLMQMFEQKTSDGRIAEVTISDYPDVEFRGYVEGFYGIPWSYEDRADLFRDTSLYKMNTYIYAPKDDPYHRSSWRTLYPDDKAQEIQGLAQIAEENNMTFCWTIHPGADYNYTTDSDGNGLVDDYEAILAKFEQVYSLGVRQFGIFYDDLDYSVANGVQHATVINNAYDYLKSKYDDIKPFVTVVTRYTNSWGASMTTYFTPFMQNIHVDTIVLWTGNSTMSAVTREYFEWPQTQTGIDRDFGVWWNYPVNDYCSGHLMMGALDCLSNDVDNINSFFLNPMSEADASKVAIYSGADYSWNIEDFNSKESWSRAIKELVPEANEEFERFADNVSYASSGNGFFFDESVYLTEDLERFEEALATGENLNAEILNLKTRFEQMKTDAAVLKTIENQALLEEITNHLDAYSAMADAGIAAMEGLAAAEQGNIRQSVEKIEQVEASLEECKACKVDVLNGQAQAYVGTFRILPLLNDMTQLIMGILNEHLDNKVQERMLTNVAGLTVQDVVYQNGAYTSGNLTAVMNRDDYIAIALPKVMNIYEVSADVTPADCFKIQYSLNGIEWFDMEAAQADGKLSTDQIVTGAYARIICTADNTEMNLKELSVSPAYGRVMTSIRTNLPTYLDYTIEKALDGDLSTNFWSSSGTGDNSYISVDLGALAALGTVEVYSGINKNGTIDAFANTRLEVSEDGLNWTQVDTTKSLDAFEILEDDELSRCKLTFDAGGATARYFRLAAEENSESWAKIFEIVYDAEYIDYVNRAKAETNMGIYGDYAPANAVDGNISTWMWTNNESNAGDYITVDLGTLVPLYDAGIYFGQNQQDPEQKVDGFAGVTLQISADGETWTDAGTAVSMDDYREEGACYVADFTADGSLVRYLRFVADSDYSSWVKVYEVTYNELVQTSKNASGSVTTNLGTYGSDAISNAMDGDMNTRYYSSSGANTDSYIQVDFGKTIPVLDATIYFGGSPRAGEMGSDIDGFARTKLEVSTDGSTWQQVGQSVANTDYKEVSGKYAASIETGGVSARYIRFMTEEASEKWLQVYEIELNRSIDTNAVRFVEGSAEAVQSNYLDDSNLATAPVLNNVKENDTLIYPANTITDVGTLLLYQDSDCISNAQVSVELTDGTWKDIGVFDRTLTEFTVNRTILAVKLTFDGTVQPVIYEIILSEMDKDADADYTEVNEAKAAAAALNRELYKDLSAVDEAVAAVEEGKNITEQAAVDAMAEAIMNAIAALEYKDADYTKVKEAIKAANALDKTQYKDFSAVEAAIAAVVEGKDIREQAEVDAMAKAIMDAIDGLESVVVVTPELPYTDVSENDWFYDYVYDVYIKELMTGLEKTIFAPNNNLVRAQFAVILYRMEGEPEITFKDTFPDVKDGNFYSDAVIWAADNGIVTGYTGTGLFGPNDPITREQMAAMMFRYAKYKKMDTTARASLSIFPDSKNVQAFATDAVKWCVAEKIISGKGDEPKLLDPQGNTVRAEAATIISRYTDIAK